MTWKVAEIGDIVKKPVVCFVRTLFYYSCEACSRKKKQEDMSFISDLKDKNEDTYYTEAAQDLFNDWYTYYLTKIEDCV